MYFGNTAVDRELSVTCDPSLASLHVGREWELITAFGETRAPGGLVYQFEYRIKVSAKGDMSIVIGFSDLFFPSFLVFVILDATRLDTARCSSGEVAIGDAKNKNRKRGSPP